MPKFTLEQELAIVNKYQTGQFNCADLGREYNCHRTNINNLLRRHNVPILDMSLSRQRYILNQNYFDTINTEDKAYFLGLLYADGTNSYKKSTVRLGLSVTDVDILHKFNDRISFNKPLVLTKLSEKHPNWQDHYTLSITNKHMSKQLGHLGCFPNKTLTLKFPTTKQVPHSLIRHFIRGYWDGDGGFYLYDIFAKARNKSYKSIQGSVVSTNNFCLSLEAIFLQELNITCTIKPRHKDRNTTTRQLWLCGTTKAFKVEDWLYKDSTIYLDRKYNKYLEHKTWMIQTGRL